MTDNQTAARRRESPKQRARRLYDTGSGLLKGALTRTLAAADIAGLRAFGVHAKDGGARAFYEHFDFIPAPSDPMHLFVVLKDIRVLIRR